MSGIPSLAFAVGVYLPLSSSTPILSADSCAGWSIAILRVKFRPKFTGSRIDRRGATRAAASCFASRYIAGGALAGIVIAIMKPDSLASSPLARPSKIGPWQIIRSSMARAKIRSARLSSRISLILCVLLYLTGRGHRPLRAARAKRRGANTSQPASVCRLL